MLKLTIEELQEIETEMLKEVSEICERNNLTYYLAYGSALGAVRHGGPIPWDPDADIIIPYNEMNHFIKTIRNDLSEKYFLDFHDINKHYYNLFPRIGLKGFSTSILHIDVFTMCGLPEKSKKFKKKLSQMILYKKIHLYKAIPLNYKKDIPFKRRIITLVYKILLLPININWVRKKYYRVCGSLPLQNSKYAINSSGSYGIKEIVPKNYYDDGVLKEYNNIFLKVPKKHDDYLRHFYSDYMRYPPIEERKTKDEYHVFEVDI